ncbi:DUF3828 domain-containing protein [Enterobacter soli]|jgi:hypothetical protein|nr:DUF3828 domain-containing protein [Enterobacter soli]
MKTWLFFLFVLAFSARAGISDPSAVALKFNQWYIGQLQKDISPLLAPDLMKEYVAMGTIEAIKKMYSGDSNDKDMPDADMFIKSQDWDEDWKQVTVLYSDFDAVCANVYIAFGKKQEHVVSDCLVQEKGKWKVRSTTLIK